MNRLVVASVAACVALLSNPVWSAEHETESKTPSAGVTSTISLTATVEKIDKKSRELTLKGPEGNTVTVAVGPEAYNLDQIKVGDQLNIEYTQAVVMELRPAAGGEEERGEVAALERAPKGEKPSGIAARHVEVKATVEAIDTKSREVTLKGPEQTLTLPVGKDVDLGKIKVGDQVLASYVEALAMSVEPAKEKSE